MSSLKNKLYNYEQAPPAKAWDKIAAALDESHLGEEFPATLYNLQATPPLSAWDKIRSSLDEELDEPIAIPRRRTGLILRYAAAAAIVGILIFSGLKLFRNTSSGNKSNETSPIVKTETPVKETPVTVETPVIKTPEIATNAVAAVPNKTRNRANPLLIGSNNPVQALEPRVTRHERHETGITAAIAHTETPTTQMGRYITLMTPDGNIIRMSNKLSDMVCCVSGEDQDNDCKFQMKKWREKIASSTQVASPGNFMDILNMVNCLQEN